MLDHSCVSEASSFLDTPAKKRQRGKGPPIPDGFQVAKRKRNEPQHPPAFVSGFNVAATSSSSSNNTDKETRNKSKSSSVSASECDFFTGNTDTTKRNSDGARPNETRRPTHRKPLSAFSISRRSNDKQAADVNLSVNASPLRSIQPSYKLSSSIANQITPRKAAVNDSGLAGQSIKTPVSKRLRPLTKQPPVPPSASKNADRPISSPSNLFLNMSFHDIVSRNNTQDNMRTPSAIATDLSITHERAVAESAPNNIEGQPPGIAEVAFPSDENMDVSRGLQVSPEKTGKSDKRKFYGVGLARRAADVFSRAHTSHGLWAKQLEQQTSSYVTTDLLVEIVKIMHRPIHAKRTADSTSSGLALCRVLNVKASLQNSIIQKSGGTQKLYPVMFLFPHVSTQHPNTDHDNFQEHNSVAIWTPFQEVPSSTHHPLRKLLSASPLADSELPPGDDRQPLRDVLVHDTLLVCSRFSFRT